MLSDGERVLGEVRTALPEVLVKEPVTVTTAKNVIAGARKGGKVRSTECE